jgi:hypothetical protein
VQTRSLVAMGMSGDVCVCVLWGTALARADGMPCLLSLPAAAHARVPDHLLQVRRGLRGGLEGHCSERTLSFPLLSHVAREAVQQRQRACCVRSPSGYIHHTAW